MAKLPSKVNYHSKIMIPISLKIKGLYSYKTEQTIDFEQLTNASLFGIFGSVGSGKSSILEAITFALYKDTERLSSRDNRSYNMMNLSSDELLIDFVCRAGNENDLYRFVVSGKRKKKFEDVGTLERTIYQKNEILNDWMPISYDNITEKIIGLNYDNFKRTIIIPQGQFQNFIELGSTERTKLMKELFQLEKYDLSEKTKRLISANKNEKIRVETMLNSLGEATQELADQGKHDLKLRNEEKKAISTELEIFIKNDAASNELKTKFENLKIIQLKIEILAAQKSNFEIKKNQLAIYEKCVLVFKNIFENKAKSSSNLAQNKANFEKLEQELSKKMIELQAAEKEIVFCEPLYENREEYLQNANELAAIFQIKTIENQTILLKERIIKGEGMIEKNQDEFVKLKYEKNEKEKEFEQKEAKWKAEKTIEILEEKILQFSVSKALASYAENLKNGKPCPLCGALDHPSILHAEDDFQAKINALSAEKQAIENEKNNFIKILKGIEISIEKLKTELDKLNEVLAKVKQELATKEGESKPYISILKNSKYADYQLLTNLEIQSKATEAKVKYDEIISKFEIAQKKFNTVKPMTAELEGKKKTLTENIDFLQKEVNNLEAEIVINLAENTFENEQEVSQILKQNLNLDIERKAIQSFETDFQTGEQLLKIAVLETNNLSYDANLHQDLKTKLNTLKSDLDTINNKIGSAETQLKKLEENLIQKADLLKENHALDLREETLKTMDSLFRGSGFVDFVSKIYLENLCKTANERFFKMTKQQLSLEVNSNNDFEVIDLLNSGRKRLLKTLSGGQKFQAALALALALADTVHARSASKNNFFFIDEGFGSLDKDALAIVFSTLQSLKKENRIIGIISHVEELQQEIQTYIKITNGENGSEISLAS